MLCMHRCTEAPPHPTGRPPGPIPPGRPPPRAAAWASPAPPLVPWALMMPPLCCSSELALGPCWAGWHAAGSGEALPVPQRPPLIPPASPLRPPARRDVLGCLERDPLYAKSGLLYKLYNTPRTAGGAAAAPLAP